MTIQDDLRRLAEAATPGQWTTEKPGKDANGFSQGMIIAAVGRGQGIYANPPGGSFPEADRRFIGAANPATIISLCDQLDALQAENSRLSAREWSTGGPRCDGCDNGINADWDFCPYCGIPTELNTEPCTDKARMMGCTCRMSSVNSASTDPPEPILNEWCPVHGRDSDYELQKLRDGE